MILVIAMVRVHPDKAQEYEAACCELMPALQAANPGIVFYKTGKCREEPNTYRVVEAYEDQAAMDRHVGSERLKEAFARLQPCIAELEIKLHEVLGNQITGIPGALDKTVLERHVPIGKQ